MSDLLVTTKLKELTIQSLFVDRLNEIREHLARDPQLVGFNLYTFA